MKEHDEMLARLQSQYRELANNSAASIISLTKQRKELRGLIRSIVEISKSGPIKDDEENSLFNDYTNHGQLIQTKELQQLLRDCQEALK